MALPAIVRKLRYQQAGLIGRLDVIEEEYGPSVGRRSMAKPAVF